MIVMVNSWQILPPFAIFTFPQALYLKKAPALVTHDQFWLKVFTFDTYIQAAGVFFVIDVFAATSDVTGGRSSKTAHFI
jgi:hypothetical protein